MFLNPKQIVSALAITPGLKIADLGAGTGAFSVAFSERLGENGKVYSIEVQEPLFLKLKDEIKTRHLSNIEPILADIESRGGTHIIDSLIDVVLLSNVMFQVEDKDGCIEEVKRIIKSGGKVVVIDWTDSFLGMGPRPESIFSEEKARSIFENKGFKFVEKINTGEHHYGIIFTYEK